MKSSIWKISDQDGKELGLLTVPSFLDVIDVIRRAENVYGCKISSAIYVGDV